MAMKPLSTFAPNEVSIVLTTSEGTHVVSGFAEDSICTIDRASDTFEMYIGADDSPTRLYKANTATMVTITLAQTSLSNDIMSQLYERDRSTRNGVFSLFVGDNSGRTKIFAEEAYIGVVPNAQFGNSMQTRDWVIHAPSSIIHIGGNSKFTPEDQALFEALGGVVPPQWQA